MMKAVMGWLALSLAFTSIAPAAIDLAFPTGNDALLRPGGEADFFQPTIAGTIESGMFGCGRARRFHEGIDIKCLQRDRRGEPTDPVMAIAEGRVAFINPRPALSNYGCYVIVEHRWDGVPVYSLYAHLGEIADGLTPGQTVSKGQRLGTLGHSTNTRERIAAERAHLHLEINFLLNPHFDRWYLKRDPKAPPFKNFNGQNLIGLDAAALFRARAANPQLNFAGYLAKQPIAFTVLVKSHALAHLPQPANAAACEIGVTAWGLPVAAWPRTTEQIAGKKLPALNLVNEAELARFSCRRLVESRRTGHWQLSDTGREWLELVTYNP